MPTKKEIPKKPRFEFASGRAYDILAAIGAKELPVNVWEINDFFSNIFIIPYTEYKNNPEIPKSIDFDKVNSRIDEFNKTEQDPAKRKEHLEVLVQMIRELNYYFIVIDDRLRNRQRERWSIAHELGHILLGHLIEFEDLTQNRLNMTSNEYGVLETEANWFASELLGPSPIIALIEKRLSVSKISLLCGISPEAASKKARQINNRYNHGYLENRQMMLNFSQYIFSRLYLKSIYTEIHERIEVSPQLFWDLNNLCRVCSKCGAYIDNPGNSYCHWCGETLELQTTHGMHHILGSNPPLPEGKVYTSIEENEQHRVIYCPKCKNHLFNSYDEFCYECQTPLYNHCLEEGMKLPTECRRCPSCGGLTDYSEIYDKIKDVKIPRPARCKSFNRLESWEYLRYMLMKKSGYPQGVYLYAVLSDSAVYSNKEYCVLVFAGHKRHISGLLNHLPFITGIIKSYGLLDVKKVYLYYYDKANHSIYRIIKGT